MYNYQISTSETLKDKDDHLISLRYFYGDRFKDEYLFRDPQSLPRYGHLARKLLMRYAGDHYNPHTICISQEPFIRLLIKTYMEYKVFYRLKEYDWEYLDHFFKKVVDDYYNLGLDYNMAVIKRGFRPKLAMPQFSNSKKAN